MIDEDRTMQLYGYTSDELKPKSHKPIVRVCEECGTYNVVRKQDYTKVKYPDLCQSCIVKKRYEDPTEREKTSAANRKRFEDPAEREKMSIASKKVRENDPTISERQSATMKTHFKDPAMIKKWSDAKIKYWLDPENHKKASAILKEIYANTDRAERISIAGKKRFEDPIEREKLSATKQGIPYEEWKGFAKKQKYCPKFNERIKQYIRDKYNNCDYMSGIIDTICNNGIKLSVHHIDYNKQQGCDDHEWKLVPISQKNHGITGHNKQFWNRLFTYSLQYDGTYYEDEPVDIWSMLK